PQAGLGGSPMFPYCSKEKAVSEQDAKHPTIETGADSAKLDFSRKIVLYYSQIKIDRIHSRPVILIIVSLVRWLIVSQRRSTTFSNVENTSLQKPLVRNSRQICSMGFISGV
ncbi:MAG: hypothetical protein MR821_10380, partial [Clostridiales bacterium]|nr:hypothetical protein [Clostridiales bacterium]